MNLRDSYGRPWFRVGDLVTRDGTDVHRVIGSNGDEQYAPDLIDVVCVKAPSSPWTAVGETERNCASRYNWAGAELLSELGGVLIGGEVNR